MIILRIYLNRNAGIHRSMRLLLFNSQSVQQPLQLLTADA